MPPSKKSKKDQDLIRSPEQARSRETMDKILAAMEELLKEKPYDRITIQEIALRSDTGVSSIYARFRDKQILVLGLHHRLREQTMECLDELTATPRWESKSVEQIIKVVVPHCVKYYRTHAALMRASLRIDLPEMRERQATVLNFASQRFNALIAPRYPNKEKEVAFAVDGCVRMLASMMYTAFIFHEIDSGTTSITNDRANIKFLTQSIIATINAAVAD